MTFGKLVAILEKNGISKEAEIVSDSGWECCATDTDGVYYCKEENTVILTQGWYTCYESEEYKNIVRLA